MVRFLKNIFHYFNALFAAIFYGFPGKQITVIGITGTDGKTTTSNILYHIFKSARIKISMISTVEAVINGKTYDTGFHVTTPSPWDLQKYLKKAVQSGSKYFILETTSHALDQHRVLGCNISIALITNISHEHLDYHHNMKKYVRAKSKILKNVKYSIINKDDKNYPYLKKHADGKILTFSVNQDADFSSKKLHLKPSLPGKFNLYNSLAAYAIAVTLGVDPQMVKKAISTNPVILGRMEEIKTDRNFKIYIDFAHKPNALQQALLTARQLTRNKLIVVFGSAGLRDRTKRPIMGKIAGEIADYIILTAEDPRTEDVRDIIGQIARGIESGIIAGDKKIKNSQFLKKDKKYFWKIPDRQEAINFAVRKLATKGDLIILAGKGHEKSMCYGKIEYSWDEKKAIEKALYGSVKNSTSV